METCLLEPCQGLHKYILYHSENRLKSRCTEQKKLNKEWGQVTLIFGTQRHTMQYFRRNILLNMYDVKSSDTSM